MMGGEGVWFEGRDMLGLETVVRLYGKRLGGALDMACHSWVPGELRVIRTSAARRSQ